MDEDNNLLEIQSDFSDPDFTENGRDYWEHYHYVVEPGHVLLRIDKYLVERADAPECGRLDGWRFEHVDCEAFYA